MTEADRVFAVVIGVAVLVGLSRIISLLQSIAKKRDDDD